MNTSAANQHTILSTWVGAVLDALAVSGLSRADLCAAANVFVPENAAAGFRQPQSIMRPIWDEVFQLTGNPAFPIDAARSLKPTSMHTLGFSVLTAATLDESCRVLQRNFQVISTAGGLQIHVDPNQYGIASCCEPVFNDEDFEMFMAYVTETLRLLWPEDVAPLQVKIRRPISAPKACQRYRDYFRAPVEFGACENAIVFPRQIMFEPLGTGTPAIRELSERLAGDYLERFGSGSFKTLVRSSILDLLSKGRASEERVAQALNLSRSSLARRLRGEGTTYRLLFRETLLDMALQYLQDTNLPIGEISWRLGFQDMGSFSRTFKRWTGMPPREWRQMNSDGAGSKKALSAV